MLYFVDSANAEAVRRIAALYPIAGVTTNPTICARENRRDFAGMMRQLRQAAGEQALVFAQTMHREASGMVCDAQALRALVGEPFCVKVPATAQGIAAVRQLKQMGIDTAVTAVFTAQQALLAAQAGAGWVAPYVNKADDILGDGAQEVAQIASLFDRYGLHTKILAASFRNLDQVNRCALSGAHAVTLPPAFFEKLLCHPLTDLALAGFEADWHSVYGDASVQALAQE